MNWKRLREKVVEENYPGEEDLEEINEKYEEIAGFIEEEFGQETHFAGSASRQTCMKDDRDIDLFVLFSPEKERKHLEDRGLKIGKKVFDKFNGEYEIEYAEHPYTKGIIDGYEVEIVPCYEVEAGKIKSAVDRTPHHSRWVQNNLDQEQRKDVVILKKFLSAAGIYGSSLKVQGFSGYLCEILISQYGGFKELTEEAKEWQEKTVIDPEDQHEKLPEKLENKFEDEPLVVIDPVDEERNVASVMSKENFSKFIYLCWRFNEEPGMDFFQEEEGDYTEFEVKQELDKRGDMLVLEFETPEEVDDIVYPQMRKAMRRLRSEIEKHEFQVFDSGFHVGEMTRVFFELDRNLPEIQEKKGPKVFHGTDHIRQFTSKYDNVYVKGDTLVAKTEREYTDAKELLDEFLDGDLEAKGIPEYVADKIENYSFSDALGPDAWLNYLGDKFRIEDK